MSWVIEVWAGYAAANDQLVQSWAQLTITMQETTTTSPTIYWRGCIGINLR